MEVYEGKLREKKLYTGKISLYIDYYSAVWNPAKKIYSIREFLGLYLHPNPKTPIEIKSIRKARKILDNFISKRECVKDQSPLAINQIVQQTISELNDLNESNEFIDTLEREDICNYITRAAIVGGLNIKKGEDITAKYRNW